MKVIIVGGGKIGYYTAKTLRENNVDVRVIEKSPAICAKVANDLDVLVINDDGTTVEALADAGCKNADVFVAVTGRDEDNIVACQIAKRRFGVKKAIVRSNNPRNVETMKMLGADIAVSSTQIITNLIESEIDVGDLRLLATLNKGEASIVELVIPDDWSKSETMLSDLGVPKGSILVAAVHKDEMQIPRGDTVIYAGDHITAIVEKGGNREFRRLFND